ncbi:DNA primase [Aestuariicoccus sp. MJ-SS9]|uniref:DNA primase n=1 Tax=Aestuariicoccus sp. MJ-SS9 TaxID=3079855 RepID=UPI0029136FB9|nr:DNA primase [Aestuariicoccus sp. MJ-SS9]MDU8911220.1 DNA primase [Aestuariicoccus sp. MJ-SS9]
MSLPPGFLDELRTRTSLSQVVGRKVMWDARKSNQGKGDMWAPCPFHQEKSASFHVDDRKGFYYCFGCHAKGDAISFVRETENVGFMEAVEILAGEAGMPMPARDPKAQEKADRRTQMAEVMEQALQFYRLQLKTGAAGAARAYLDRRGLGAGTLDRFEIGFAPEGWQTLWDHLRGKGVAEDLILGAGLAKPSSKGGKPYDVFRNRILFPIRDARGRAIAFGGRAMDPNDNAKYLNSPETELFDKGRNLYNLGPAREAAGKGQPLIVAEGYMDVIALVEAGFGGAVAPLGTAVTETQLQLMWRLSDEPLIALDGDTAGLRAAFRVIDLALPLLEAGKSLRFALMPEGKDPDDLIRAEGAGAVQKVLDAALPMVQLMWRQETEGRVFDSPERKAALDRSLRERIKRIQDPSLRHHYGEEIKELRWQLFRPQRGGARTGAQRRWGANAPAVPVASTRASLLAAAGDEAQSHLRVAVILAAVLSAPEIVEEFETDLAQMACADPTHARLRDCLIHNVGRDADTVEEAAHAAIGAEALETLRGAAHVALTPCVRQPGNAELARMTVAEELAKLAAQAGLAAEIAEAEEDLGALADEAVTWRLAQAAQARNRAVRSQREDTAEYDTGPNGARIDRDERSAFAALMQTIRFDKPGRG